MSNQPYKLGFSLIFTDASSQQISMIRDFFLQRGIVPSNVLKTSKGTASMIAISRFDAVLAAAKSMLPYLFKKANEIQTLIDYYEGSITGNELVAIFRKEVEAGRRERHNHRVLIDVPFTLPEGDEIMRGQRRNRIRDAMGRYRAKVTPEDYQSIREEHFVRAVPLHALAKKYSQYARETIRRVLGRGRGYVLVKGRGLVTTTDTR